MKSMIKTAKEMVLDFIKQETAKGNALVDTMTISKELDLQRTNTSAILNELVRDKSIVKTKTRPVYFSLPFIQDEDSFSKLIGHEGSLAPIIKLAQAAIHYPNQSLNILIVGALGTGKSYLAHSIYQHALRSLVIQPNASFVQINCRHFIHNMDELKVHLFSKTNDQLNNLIEQAVGSFLFIDNIQYLDGSSLSRIINFVETNRLTYLDGSESEPLNTTLILSLNPNEIPELFESLRSKIPVVLKLPNLSDRPWEEKFELINSLFTEEAISTNFNIKIEPIVLSALMFVESDLNIKYLKGVIKLAVANAYLRSYDQNIETINVVLHDFEQSVQDGLLKYRNHKVNLNAVLPDNFKYFYSKKGESNEADLEYKSFYDYLNQAVEDLKNNQVNKEDVDRLINEKINLLIHEFKNKLQDSKINVAQLSKIVDTNIIEMVKNFIEESSQVLNISFPNSVVYGLSLHINALVHQKRTEKYLQQDKIDEIKENHQSTYLLAQKLAADIESEFNLIISDDEVILLTMFLIIEDKKQDEAYPQILITMHGSSSASSIAQVINDLVNLDNTYAYDMSLQSTTEEAYEALKETILDIDQGKGVIVIYDMGSIKTLLDKISEEIDTKIRTLYLPLTLIGIEASRKAAMESDIDTVYHDLRFGLKRELSDVQTNQMAIIALCHTGEGGAKEIKEYLNKNYRSDIKIYAYAISDRQKLIKEIQKIRQFYEIKAFIGTYDPKLFGIPFIPVSKIFELGKDALDALLISNMESKALDYEAMLDYLSEESDLDILDLKDTLPKTIENFDILYGLNIDQKVGLFLHIGALITRLTHHKSIPGNKNTELYFQIKKEEMHQIKKVIKNIENRFNIIIPDSEIANIYEIVRKEN